MMQLPNLMSFFPSKQIIIASSVFLMLSATQSHAQVSVKDNFKLGRQQQISFEQLENTADNLFVDWDDQYHIPDWIRMTDLEISWRSDDYVDRSYQFFEQFAPSRRR